MEIYEALQRAIDTAEPIVAGVRAEQMGEPTPCTKWDTRALLNHLVSALWLAAGLLSDTPSRYPVAPGGLPAADILEEPDAAFREAADAALDAARIEGTLERPHATPFGELPGPAVAGFTTVDMLVHGWDLARATGQEASFDEEVAQHALGFAEQAVTDDHREPLIGPAVDVPSSAPAIDRLVGFMGRRP